MIQRIQTVWLLLAALVSTSLFMLNILSITYINVNGEEVTKAVKLAEYSYLLPILAAVVVLLPALAIFMYKNRKNQVNLAILAIIMNIGFVVLHLTFIKDAYLKSLTPPAQSFAYSIGSYLPVVSIVFLIMAISGIRKDQKLIKSLDRLR